MTKSLSTILGSNFQGSQGLSGYSGSPGPAGQPITVVLQSPQSNVSSYTLTSGDSGKHIYFSNGSSSTVTIPSNANVAFDIGTSILIVNDNTGRLTVNTQANVTLQLVTSTTGNRSIASKGAATLLKVDTNKWYISGAGIK